ncbi:RpiB/LacA/LacB family sugar-phosphate isomerase [Tessaracoccus oleiagri]|uniref:Ribose 5-phosphate isomerase B n=1 Tax=Tessaracoccus oleiagri TaxID=686624 RepID=A0A1G9I615_9ACTN|nr:RpiB/LacA/LacB family sugar-phosphate isomerase [Tessaracoccus oleiagri]SDL20253.1 ribose 5-phosphate isomerase B [Tessaracoccus oleiagri]
MGLRIAIGADQSAFDLKSAIIRVLQSHDRVDAVLDVGVSGLGDETKNHEDVAIAVANAVASGTADRGLAFCGNGLGVALAANTVEGVSAVTADDIFSVRTSVTTNRATVLCMGAKVVGAELASTLVEAWLAEEMPAP